MYVCFISRSKEEESNWNDRCVQVGDLVREKSEKIKIWKIEKAEKNYVNFCDLCGWELVCTTPSDDPILCFNQVM